MFFGINQGGIFSEREPDGTSKFYWLNQTEPNQAHLLGFGQNKLVIKIRSIRFSKHSSERVFSIHLISNF